MTKSLVLGSSIFPTRASFSKHSLLQELTAPPPPPVDPFAALDALEELAGPGPEDDVTPIVAPELQARSTGVRRNRMNIDIYHSVTAVLSVSCPTPEIHASAGRAAEGSPGQSDGCSDKAKPSGQKP